MTDFVPDTGCDVAPRCLECPLPACKYDDPAAYRQATQRNLDRLVRQARHDTGLGAARLGRQFGVSERTVYRILQR